jgi:hypothetical protein
MHTIRRTSAGLLGALLGLGLGGCTTIATTHDPLYRAQAHDSRISVTARNTQVGIASISIEVTTGAMTDCSEFAVVPGMTTRSIIPCRVGAAVSNNTCTYSGAPATATCTASVAIQASTMVSYVATAVAANGQSVTAPEIAYSGGTGQPERIARPAYWHRQLDRSGRIDLGVFPDSDYGSGAAVLIDPYGRFAADLDTTLDGAFFNTTDIFANRYTGDRQFFNLWAGPFGANAEGCARTFTGGAQAVAAVMDGSAIFHRNAFRDCGSITAGGGGAGSVDMSASDSSWLLVHESGHFLFGLSDEYAGGGYIATMSCNNVYATQANCQSAAPAAGATTAQCSQIGTTGFWRIVTANETMSDRVLQSDFRDDAERCFSSRISACYNGSCY